MSVQTYFKTRWPFSFQLLSRYCLPPSPGCPEWLWSCTMEISGHFAMDIKGHWIRFIAGLCGQSPPNLIKYTWLPREENSCLLIHPHIKMAPYKTNEPISVYLSKLTGVYPCRLLNGTATAQLCIIDHMCSSCWRSGFYLYCQQEIQWPSCAAYWQTGSLRWLYVYCSISIAKSYP